MSDERIAEVDVHRGHPFYPPDDEWERIPGLYDTEKIPTAKKLIMLHYFVGGFDWWVAEVDPDRTRAFGYVCLNDPANAEWGYIDLIDLATLYRPGDVLREVLDDELLRMRIRPPLVVERDLHWTVRPVNEIDEIGGGR
ncbi:MAG TPA: hypothetical protein VEP28_15045 [Rubrobacter sp.]|nr:hypothetical protein [Rubrobacter sp.]